MSSGDVNFTVHLTFSCLNIAEQKNCLFFELNNLFRAKSFLFWMHSEIDAFELLMLRRDYVGNWSSKSDFDSATCTVKFILCRLAGANSERLITFSCFFPSSL